MPKGSFRPTCSYPGCQEPHRAHGYCTLHDARWRAHGHPDGGRQIQLGENLLDKQTKKFLRGIRKLPNGCWTCTTGVRTHRGYLHLYITENGVRVMVKVHRFSFEHFKGPIPNGLLVCHSCDNPSCCNPEHLFAGTQSVNMQDMVRKERGLVGEKNANTKFTEADILAMYRDEDAGLTRTAIAKAYGVAQVTISHILIGRNWKHLYERHRASAPV